MAFSEGLLSVALTLYQIQTGQVLIQETSETVAASAYDEKHIPWE